jgi:hypothetical protein
MRHTPSTLMLLGASVLMVRAVSAQTPKSAALNPPNGQATHQSVVSNGSQGEPLVADVVFVGAIENAARLANEISVLLSAHGITPRFEQRTILRENELVAKQKSNDRSRGTVWILAPNATLVRLVFADNAQQRFLIREVPLPEGLDDVARESIGQIVESSLLALLQGAAAISRTEVHQAMGQFMDATPVAPAPPVAAPAQPQAPAPPVPDTNSTHPDSALGAWVRRELVGKGARRRAWSRIVRGSRTHQTPRFSVCHRCFRLAFHATSPDDGIRPQRPDQSHLAALRLAKAHRRSGELRGNGGSWYRRHSGQFNVKRGRIGYTRAQLEQPEPLGAPAKRPRMGKLSVGHSAARDRRRVFLRYPLRCHPQRIQRKAGAPMVRATGWGFGCLVALRRFCGSDFRPIATK